MNHSHLEAALFSLDWRFDAEHERFTDGRKRVDYRRVLALVPGMTMDDLASYVTTKHEEWIGNKQEQ